jgi:hypothetical protein
MNNSWLAYENGLALLFRHTPPERPEHERIHALRASLLENIKQVSSYGDAPELCMARKSLIMNLNSIVQQATGVSFIELCISTSPMLAYLTCVYKAAYHACSLFSGEEEIWVDQCKNTVKLFHKKPLLDDIATDISDTTTSLYHIDQCITELLELLEDIEKYCPPNRRPTERLRVKRAEIREALKQCLEKIQDIDHTFAELICWHQEVVLSISPGRSEPLPSFRQEQAPSSPPRDSSGENNYQPPKAQPDVAAQEKQHQATHQKQEGEEPPESNVSPSQQMTMVPASRNDATTQKEPVDRETHIELVKLVLQIPGIEDPGTRLDLLRGIPNPQSFQRNYANVYTDISHLIDQLTKLRLRSGEPAILIFIDNAILRVQDTTTEDQLKVLRQKINASFPREVQK